MKNKPLKHRETNTFRFEPFAQRIANIKIDVFRKVKHKYEEDDDDETTYFHQTLEKWTTLNLSNPFEELYEELGPDLKILPQLIKKKNHVVSVLEKHLQKRDPLNVQCILELIVALANDLRQDFHPHFLPMYHQMIPLVESRNPELMEWTFHALAYLFKFLWRCLVTNLTEVFDSLLPLLSSAKPQYINSFAAQSFAFVARKVREPVKLVKLTIRSLKKFPDGVDGCGRLIYEVVKGVPGQFHSCADQVLDAFLESLADPNIPQNLLSGVLSSSLGHQLSGINVEHIPLVWMLLLKKLQTFRTAWKQQPDSLVLKNAVDQILRMLLQATEFKNGLMVTDPAGLVNPLFKLLQPGEGTDSWTASLIDIFSSVLLSPCLKMTQELSSLIVKTSMTLLVENDLITFVTKTKPYFGFEGLILPRFLSFCSTKPPLTMLDTLADLVLEKAPMTQSLEELLAWTPYTLDFSSTGSSADLYGNSYLDVLRRVDFAHNYDLDALANALVVLPNISPLDQETARGTVAKIVSDLCAALEDAGPAKLENVLALLPLAVETLIKLKPQGGISAAVTPDLILKHLLRHSNAEHLSILRILDFYVSCDEGKKIEPSGSEIQRHMFPLIGSPYSKVRSLALHIVLETAKLGSDDSMMVDFLENSIEAENTPVTIAEYRERLKTFQKLSCANPTVADAVTKGIVDGKIFLRHLLGNLYVNFKLLWEPLSTIIVSYSQAMPIGQFWEVYHGYLNEVAGSINAPEEETKTPNFQADHLTEVTAFLNDLDERPDHIHCRILLLKILQECSPICEAKNKDMVTLFLNFLNDEYFKKNAEAAKTWDITRKTEAADAEMMDASTVTLDDSNKLDASVGPSDGQSNESKDPSAMEVDVDDSNLAGEEEEKSLALQVQDEDEQIKKELREAEPDFDKKFRWVTKSLLAHLAVFAKLRSPKSMHKEQELYKIYIDFLSHKFPDVQKAALDCIMTYKFKYLVPYRENLYGLIDDKTFKTEVSLFRIDTESDVVKAQHRPDLIPLVLRIVYSKMYTKSSATKSTANKQARKATVIRFLAGCDKLELESFFHMAFSLFHEWVSRKDILEVLDEITRNVNLKAVIPPRRLQSAVYLLNTVLVYCGGLLGPSQLGYLLRVVLSMMAHLTGILQNREDVFPGYLKAIRSIRNTCFEVLARFYKTFESYPWTVEETEAVFKVFVWPYLSKLTVEGIHSPTSQLRLFMVWSQNPRYFVLLGKTHDDDPKLSPIETIMNLWLCEKSHGSVCNAILEIVQRLMTVEDYIGTKNDHLIGGGEVVRPLEVAHQATFDDDKLKEIQGTQALNYGSKLLVRYVPVILERLRRKLANKKGLDRKEREVMSRVTELVTDAESSEVLLELLLPVLIKKAESSDDVISPLLTTVYNLIKNVSHPGRYVRKLAPLYGSVASPSARKVLFSIVIALSKLEGSESGLDEQLLDDLNAFDATLVDQPDFTRRLSAFNKLELLADKGTIEVNLGVIEKDSSLRDNSRHCLEKVCSSLCRRIGSDPAEKNYVLDNIILGQIRRGFKPTQPDNVRNDSISLLGYMARECGDFHPVLKDLSHFANKQDMEVDFFENLRHLQLHRRVRAMLKFSTVVTSLETPPASRTLTQFILPIISHYLVSEKYQNKNTIVDSAIKALGTTCQYLPWHQYQTVLTHYIAQLQSQLEFQKQIVRLLVEILNAFHFDLTKADLTGLMEVKGVLARKWRRGKEVMEETQKPVESNVEEPTPETPKESESTPKMDGSLLDENEEEGDQTKMEEELDEADDTVIEAKGSIDIVLSPGSATKVITVITQQILPKLHQIMAQKTAAETHHKLTRKMTGPERDEEEVLKVPLAVAAVKLLQKLPSKQFLDVNLPGIFMKLCTFLKSRLESVRRVTRDTLQTIMVALGPDYLPTLIREMRFLLTRGYQVHVLVYSVHSILVPLEPLFQKGHLDKCANSIIDICRMDLFGRASEEKEVNQIAGKVLEARSTRSFDTFKILSRNITERCLVDLLLPLKEELSRTMSHKYVNKVRLSLEQIVLGLTENAFLTPEHLLLLAYGTSSESIPALIVDIKDKPVNAKRAEYEARRQPDTFIIPEEPKKTKVVEGVNTCARTNSHLLVEFGLRLLYFLLKREKVKGKEYFPHLDPFVGLIKDCLDSQHVKISTLATKCLNWMVKLELPSMEKCIGGICSTLFSILHKYAVAGLSKGDNYDLVLVTFNAVACIVRDMKTHRLTDEQLRTLVLYCEQDIEDTTRQATAFSLLKAIMHRKFKSEELTEVVKKVAYVSIKALEDSVRVQARQIVHNFIMNYSLGSKKVETFLAIYYCEFNYQYLTGRTSALEMIKNFTSAFPIKQLDEHAPIIFINVSTALVNDSEPSCRKTAAEIISLLLSRLQPNGRNKLFELTTIWLKLKNEIVHQKLAAQLVGLFVMCEKKSFETRLPELLPNMVDSLVAGGEARGGAGRFVKAPAVVEEQESTSSEERDSDHFLFQLLQSLVKIATHCPALLTDPKYASDVETIADHATHLLAHPHQWVRHNAVQLIGLVVTSYKPEEVAAVANDPSLEKAGFLLTDTRSRIKSLAHDVIAQLVPSEEMNEKFLLQCMKLLTYLTVIVKGIQPSEELKLSVPWLVRMVQKMINNEVVTSPTSTIVRTMAFNWSAAISLKLSQEELSGVAFQLLKPIARQLNVDEDDALKKSAREASTYIQKKIGHNLYKDTMAKLSQLMDVKRAERKKQRSQLMVTDPERAAKRKINKNLKKKESQKKKIKMMKMQTYKRKKRKDPFGLDD